MAYAHAVGRQRYVFDDLRTLLARASPARSGDRLAGVAAAHRGRARGGAPGARRRRRSPVSSTRRWCPTRTTTVTRLIVDSHDAAAFAPVAHAHRRRLPRLAALGRGDPAALAALAPGLTPEMAAAVCKLMRNQDLIPVGAQVPRRHALSQHARPARPPLGAPAAQPPDRRPARHRRLASLDGLLYGARRRGDRHQPGDRQRRPSVRELLRAARRAARSASRSRRSPAC